MVTFSRLDWLAEVTPIAHTCICTYQTIFMSQIFFTGVLEKQNKKYTNKYSYAYKNNQINNYLFSVFELHICLKFQQL